MEPSGVAPFPSTQWSLLSQARSAGKEGEREALESLARLYWKPIYAYLRLRWSKSQAEASDLTQEFFLALLEGEVLASAKEERGRFRCFLKACLDNFVRKEFRKDGAKVRGGGMRKLSIEFGDNPDRFLVPVDPDTPDQILDRHWRKAVLEEAIHRLERKYTEKGRAKYYEVFRRLDLDPPESRPSYEDLAKELRLTRSDVDNYLRHARKELVNEIREVLAVGAGDSDGLAAEQKDFFESLQP